MPFTWSNSLITTYEMTVLLLDAKKIVELGTGPGLSGNIFCKTLKKTGGILYSVDLIMQNCQNTVERLKQSYDNFVFIQGDSIEVAQTWDKGDIDILLCDSDHAYERVYGELKAWTKFNPKIIFIHDTFLDDRLLDPYYAAKTWAEEHGRTFLNHNWQNGLGIII